MVSLEKRWWNRKSKLGDAVRLRLLFWGLPQKGENVAAFWWCLMTFLIMGQFANSEDNFLISDRANHPFSVEMRVKSDDIDHVWHRTWCIELPWLMLYSVLSSPWSPSQSPFQDCNEAGALNSALKWDMFCFGLLSIVGDEVECLDVGICVFF